MLTPAILNALPEDVRRLLYDMSEAVEEQRHGKERLIIFRFTRDGYQALVAALHDLQVRRDAC